MKLLTKNGYKFATGMFWQIPDEGKRVINTKKLIKDTKHNMFCQCKTINPTWGFCQKDELVGEKNVASLAKFIVETSNLTSDYSNSIICYKFKNYGELDENGRPLDQDLYGYVVLLNGTICPDEGEYVAEIAIIYESIIAKAKKHDIEALYLPLEVANKFFSIFEILSDAFNNENLLNNVIENITIEQRSELKKFINDNYEKNSNFQLLFNEEFNLNIDAVKSFIKDDTFESHLRIIKDKTLKYLISNVYILPYTSDYIFWNNKKFKSNYKKSLLKPVSTLAANKLSIFCLLIISGISGYLLYDNFLKNEEVPPQVLNNIPSEPKPIAVIPSQLINSCVDNNDKYFKDLGNWSLIILKCDSLNNTLSFSSDNDATLDEFEKLVNDNKNINLTNKVGTYIQKVKLPPFPTTNVKQFSKDQLISNLQQASINYSFELRLSGTSSFSITSQLSPVFLWQHKILENLKLKEINMTFDKTTGFYSWSISGEF